MYLLATGFNSEQYQPQLSVKYEWSRVPHQEHLYALVVSHCGLGVSPSRASGVRRRRAEGIPGGR
ncbi:hypothetical protein [Scytonema sp. HK-05]|uniref:hypothetical protein n=1 Tax=Scytonema sp. HK-05 TaxID=1137095 RepID=UPI0011612FD3